ncbi:MAG: APC family permease [Gemmatimonadaceae bacterium]
MKKLPAFFGASFGVAVAVGSIIGAGILRAPHDVAQLLPHAWMFLGVWVLGGVYALLGANVFSELGAMRPRSGGQYAIALHAFGPFTAFAVGWNDWVSICGSVAAVSIVFAEAVTTLVGIPQYALAISMLAAIAAGFVLLRGSRAMNASQNFTSLAKTLGFLALTIACFTWAAGHQRAPEVAAVAPSQGLLLSLVLALQGVIFAYDGWTGIIYFGEETRDPARDIPRSLFGGVISVMIVYLLLNVAILLVLPMSTIAADALPTAAAATTVFGSSGSTIVRLLIVIALPSSILANQAMGSRVAFALGRDMKRLSALGNATDSGAPTVSVILGVIVTLAFLLTGTFERVIAICSILFVASYAVSFAALFRMRAVEPSTPRPFRAIGHPITTGLVLVGSVAFLIGTAVAAPRDTAIAAALVLVSYPVYRLLR